MTARARIENLWDRATPVGSLLDAYRAEILREAADAVERIPADDCSDANDYDEAWDWGARAAAAELRRMADEAT